MPSSGLGQFERAAALAGVVAPILFASVVGVLSVVEYGFARDLGWDPIRRTAVGWPSVLALGDLGWLLTAALACCGALGIVFAVGFYRSTNGSPLTAVGAAALAVLAVSVGLEAFTTDPPGSVAATWHGAIHDRAYPVVVVSAIAAPAFLAAGLAADPLWRRHAVYSLVTVVILLTTLVLQVEESYAQLLEYPFFGTLLLWLELLALRVVRRPPVSPPITAADHFVESGRAALEPLSSPATPGRFPLDRDPPRSATMALESPGATGGNAAGRSCSPACASANVRAADVGTSRGREQKTP